MKINKTDHFLLAPREEKRSRGASSLDTALIILGIISVIGVGSLML